MSDNLDATKRQVEAVEFVAWLQQNTAVRWDGGYNDESPGYWLRASWGPEGTAEELHTVFDFFVLDVPPRGIAAFGPEIVQWAESLSDEGARD